MQRRRFLSIAGASLAVAGLPAHHLAARSRTWRWRGIALGARAELRLVHEDEAAAEAVIERAVAELRRLEATFSLYDPNSALSRLNRDGHLPAPPFELLEVLAEARRVHALTAGAFDVTVQPLWQLYRAHFATGIETPPEAGAIAAALARTGMDAVDFDSRAVTLGRPGMALTLNGIAQGAIADRLALVLQEAGIVDTLIDTGEIRALGHRPDGRPWQVGLADPQGGSPRPVALEKGAIATSSPAGTLFEPTGRFHHLIDPRTGYPAAAGPAQVSVQADSAMRADAVSTALALRPEAEMPGPARLGVERVWIVAHA
ncbi:MAG: FAD:protein FMN transferase [Geminicoccaceae bacterium]|nr:FAD:protein FMN transferase [Geminicoccaceae bacterium]